VAIVAAAWGRASHAPKPKPRPCSAD